MTRSRTDEDLLGPARTLLLIAVAAATFGGRLTAQAGGVTKVECIGQACDTNGVLAPFAYRIKPSIGTNISFVEIGVEDGDVSHYTNLTAVSGWNDDPMDMTIVATARTHDSTLTAHGATTETCTTCPFVLRFSGPAQSSTFVVGFSYSQGSFYHDVHWKVNGRQANWSFPVGTGSGPVHGPAPSRPNVLLIVLDDFGIDTLDCYQYNPSALGCSTPPPFPPSCPPPSPPDACPVACPPPAISTQSAGPDLFAPTLNQLAQTGVMFRRAYSYPVCKSTRAAILTGRHGFRTGMGQVHDTTPPYALPLCETTIAEMLKQGCSQPKYRCGAFGKWDSGAGDPLHPIYQGFDYYAGMAGGIDHFDWTRVEAQNIQGTPQITQPPTVTHAFSGTVVRQDALAWIQSDPSPLPFFAYVAFDLPHGPYQTAPGITFDPEVDPVGARNAYEWMVTALDTEIAELINGLGSKLANTTILIVGDNGTPGRLLLDPYVTVSGPVNDGGHGKGTLYEQGIRVPLIVHGARVPAAGIHEGVVSIVDLFRTIADLAGATLDPVGTPGLEDSLSLYPLLQDPAGSLPRSAVYAESFVPNGSFTENCTSDPDECPNSHSGAMMSTEFKYLRAVWYGAPCTPVTIWEGAYRLTGVDPAECDNLMCSTLSPLDQPAINALRQAMLDLSGL